MKFLRYSEKDDDQSGIRLDTLQNRIIALAIIAFLLEDESLDRGLLKDILDFENVDEWSTVVRSLSRIVGDEPEHSIINQAKELISYILNKFDSTSDKECWKKHFEGVGWLLPIFKDPSEPLVERIIQIASYYSSDSWDHYEIVEYLEPFKDINPVAVGKLFYLIVSSGRGYVSYPDEKIKAICLSLKAHGYIVMLANICRVYSDKLPNSPLTKEICGMI